MNKIKFKDIFNYQKKSKIKAGEGKNLGKYPFFTSSNILNKYVDEYLYDGEFLIFGTGGSASINYYNGKFSTSSDNFIVGSNNDVNCKYIYYYLKNNLHILENGFKGAGLKHLSKEYLDNIIIPIPNKELQDKIVNLEDNLEQQEKILNLANCEIEKLICSKFQSIFEDLSSYENLSLSDCSNFIDYRGHTPKVSSTGEIRMINAKSVGDGYFKYIAEFIDEELYTSWMHRGFAYPGDILFVTEGATFGNVCLIPNDLNKFALGQRVITIQGKNNIINNNYLYNYMKTKKFKNAIEFYKTGGTAKGIRSKDLLKIMIPIPPYNLQQEFSKFYLNVMKIQENIHNNLDELNKMKKSIIKNMI